MKSSDFALKKRQLPVPELALAVSPDQGHRQGFRNAERMRRAFHRILGVGPQDYRARFKSTVLN